MEIVYPQINPANPIAREDHIVSVPKISLFLNKLAKANINFCNPRTGEVLVVTDPDPKVLTFIVSLVERVAMDNHVRFDDLNDPINPICIIDIQRDPKINVAESSKLFDTFTRDYLRFFSQRRAQACCNAHTRFSIRFKNANFCSLVHLSSTDTNIFFLAVLEALSIEKAGAKIFCFPKDKWIYRFMYANNDVKRDEFLFDAPLIKRQLYTRRRVPRNFIINTMIREGNRSDVRDHNQALNINYTTPLEFGYSIMLSQAPFFENLDKILLHLTGNNFTLDIRKLVWNFNLELPFNQSGCNICLSAYSSYQEIIQIGRCGHAMHSKCFHKLISANLDSLRCIVCRQDLMLIIVSDPNGMGFFQRLNSAAELVVETGIPHAANI